MALRKVNTATLIRGELYTLRHPDNKPTNPKDSLRFKKGEPVVIEEAKILSILENLMEETKDGDGELYEKPVFRINRNVDAPGEEGSKARPTRLSATRTIKKVPLRRKA